MKARTKLEISRIAMDVSLGDFNMRRAEVSVYRLAEETNEDVGKIRQCFMKDLTTYQSILIQDAETVDEIVWAFIHAGVSLFDIPAKAAELTNTEISLEEVVDVADSRSSRSSVRGRAIRNEKSDSDESLPVEDTFQIKG